MIVDGEAIREIHILSSSDRPPKQIVRDVETTLLARFNQPIDHRVVSVAYTRPASGASAANGGAAPAERPARPDAQGGISSASAPDVTGTEAGRLRFVSVNLFVTGARVQAQVELRWKGLTRLGSASGTGTRQGALPLVAQATLEALRHFLEDDVALAVEGVELIPLGRRQIVVVSLVWMSHRQEKPLTGTCTVEGDVQQAVVLATLSALNRLIGGLNNREPVEYR